MKLIYMKLSFFLPALIFILQAVNGQDDCGSKLLEARKLYKQGIIEDIPSMLKPCIENGFTRIQRNDAYKILILAYLFDGDQLNAENTMIEFLKKNPEYEVMSDDAAEFVSLFESFRTLSVFSFGLKIGPNFTNPRIIEPYSTGNSEYTKSKNILGGGYQVGISLNRYISKKLFLNLGINYVHNSYKFTDEFTTNVNSELPIGTIVSFKESVNRYEIPLSLGYEFEYGALNYFVRTGASISKIGTVSGIPEMETTGAKITMTDFRKRFFYSYHIGAGAKFKIPRGFLVLDIRYHFGLNNIVKSDLRFENPELNIKYHYLDDDFSLKSLSIAFGYYFSFYQPKKNQ